MSRPDILSLNLWQVCCALEAAHEPESLNRARLKLAEWGISEDEAWSLFQERFGNTTTMEMV